MLSIGITTAPRGTVYIGQSLASYFDEWSITPFVFAEPKSPAYINRSRVIEIRPKDDTPRFGCIGNWLRAIEHLYGSTNTPFIMTCEDDIDWSKGSGDKVRKLITVLLTNPLDELPLEKIGFISPYCSKTNAPKERGWRPPKFLKSGWCGALCMIFPRDSIKKLLSCKERFLELTIDPKFPDKGQVHLDFAIGRFFYEQQFTIITHSPTLITHLGEVSTFEKHNDPSFSLTTRLPNLG